MTASRPDGTARLPRSGPAYARLRLLAALALAATAALRAADIRAPLLWTPVLALLITAATYRLRRRRASESLPDRRRKSSPGAQSDRPG